MAKSRIPAPKSLWRRIIDRPIVYDVLIAWFALFAGIGAAIRAFSTGTCPDFIAGWLILIAAAGVIFLAVAKFLSQWNRQEANDSVHDLEGCLLVLHTLLTLALPPEKRTRIRIRFVIHSISADGQKFVQTMNYVGDNGVSGGVGREFPITAGIIGLAVKEKRCIAGTRQTDNYPEYVEDLEKHWGFSKRESQLRSQASMSWVAVPIGEPAEGVLFGDATERAYFDDPQVLQLVSGVAIAITNFLDLRYQVQR